MIVYLHRERAIDHARTMQRNFMVDYLKNRDEKDAALVAYVGDNKKDWRFSLVRMEYKTIQTEMGKVKVKEDFTPARRYSFLVGENEPNHTAQVQLLPILEDSQQNPKLEKIEAAFNIESVTKEFFEKYKNLYLQLKEELDDFAANSQILWDEFAQRGIDTSAFAKKLLGQIVFLYFLQKKGWLGVQPGKEWGTGSKNFLFELFEKKFINYQNFFNEIIEPLFYEALAVERTDNFYKRLNCRIPFLNGGLFEPIGGYDWQQSRIKLKNSTFQEIFDTLNLYNFTVREDEPLEREVAVDPEMLGKVFENLLEVKDRKSKGAFYTPREIVHYMCQESLINYLDTALNQREQKIIQGSPEQGKLFGAPTASQKSLTTGVYAPVVPRKELETFIHNGEMAVENDAAKVSGSKSYDWIIPENVRIHAKIIDQALADIKICDPAIGSGAFPVGMMSEVVKAREVLSIFLKGEKNRNAYNFKRHTIENSIYGVDIDRSAVDIARLRLWLSLVVDEDDFQIIKPLPNLDYKIVCGNSLHRLTRNLFNQDTFNNIEKLKSIVLKTTITSDKEILKAKINKEINKLLDGVMQFDFTIFFSEVFNQSSGFDIVIGNPPYVRVDEIPSNEKSIYKNIYFSTKGKYDLYYLFIERGIQILNPKGTLEYITPNKYCASISGSALREFIFSHMNSGKILSTSKLNVFEDAANYPVITELHKIGLKNEFQVIEAVDLHKLEITPDNYYILPKSTIKLFPGGIIPINVNQGQVDIILRILKRCNRLKDVFSISEGLRIPQSFELDRQSDYSIVKQYQFEKWTPIRDATFITRENLEKVVTVFSSRYQKIISPKKIIIAEDGLEITATLDTKKYVPQGGVYFGVPTNIMFSTESVLALLNSKLLSSIYKILFGGMHMGGGYLRYRSSFLEELPVPIMSKNQIDELGNLCGQILEKTKNNDTNAIQIEEELNQKVYEFYCLELEEIELINNF
jgi:hypothetical protein